MRPLMFALAAAAIAAPVAAASDKGVPPATPVGPPIDCVQLSDIRGTHVRSDQVIDFEMRGRKMLRNTLPASCSRLGFEDRFSYSVTSGRLCSIDTITVLDTSGVRGPTCGLGQFQPVSIAK